MNAASAGRQSFGTEHHGLRFLTDLSACFTNTLAEQDGRMMKLSQKFFEGFRSEVGATDFADIRSVFSIDASSVWNMLQTLDNLPSRLIAD